MKFLNSLLKLDNFDFRIDTQTMGKFKSMMEQLVSSSPSDSFIKFSIKKSSDSKFISIVSVSSKKLTFVVETICTSPFTAFRKTWRLATTKVSDWSKNRFTDAIPCRIK